MKFCIAFIGENDKNLHRKLFIPLGIDEQKQVDRFNQLKSEDKCVELHYHSENVVCEDYNESLR